MSCEPKKNNTISETELNETDWWWRRFILGEFKKDSSSSNPYQIVKSKKSLFASQSSEWDYWKKNVEYPSYRYELARRCLGRDNYLPWPKLTSLQQSFLLGSLKEESKPVCVIAEPLKQESNWSDPMLPWQWRLDASDKSLIEKFITFINEERRRKNMPDNLNKKKSKSGISVSSNEGNNNRGVSWRGIELMDIQFFKIRKFENNTETSLVSKKKKEAQELSKVVKKCFKTCDSLSLEETENSSYNFVFKFLQENFNLPN